MDVALFSPGKKTGDVVGGRATGFATKAGFGAALTAITGAAVAAVQQIGSISVDPAIKVAALGLIGLGALAWSIAATGDVLARAYASAHVVPGDGGGSPTPVGQWALTTVIREAAKAPGLVAQVLAEAQATSSSRPSGEGHLRVTRITSTVQPDRVAAAPAKCGTLSVLPQLCCGLSATLGRIASRAGAQVFSPRSPTTDAVPPRWQGITPARVRTGRWRRRTATRAPRRSW